MSILSPHLHNVPKIAPQTSGLLLDSGHVTMASANGGQALSVSGPSSGQSVYESGASGVPIGQMSSGGAAAPIVDHHQSGGGPNGDGMKLEAVPCILKNQDGIPVYGLLVRPYQGPLINVVPSSGPHPTAATPNVSVSTTPGIPTDPVHPPVPPNHAPAIHSANNTCKTTVCGPPNAPGGGPDRGGQGSLRPSMTMGACCGTGAGAQQQYQGDSSCCYGNGQSAVSTPQQAGLYSASSANQNGDNPANHCQRNSFFIPASRIAHYQQNRSSGAGTGMGPQAMANNGGAMVEYGLVGPSMNAQISEAMHPSSARSYSALQCHSGPPGNNTMNPMLSQVPPCAATDPQVTHHQEHYAMANVGPAQNHCEYGNSSAGGWGAPPSQESAHGNGPGTGASGSGSGNHHSADHSLQLIDPKDIESIFSDSDPDSTLLAALESTFSSHGQIPEMLDGGHSNSHGSANDEREMNSECYSYAAPHTVAHAQYGLPTSSTSLAVNAGSGGSNNNNNDIWATEQAERPTYQQLLTRSNLRVSTQSQQHQQRSLVTPRASPVDVYQRQPHSQGHHGGAGYAPEPAGLLTNHSALSARSQDAAAYGVRSPVASGYGSGGNVAVLSLNAPMPAGGHKMAPLAPPRSAERPMTESGSPDSGIQSVAGSPAAQASPFQITSPSPMPPQPSPRNHSHGYAAAGGPSPQHSTGQSHASHPQHHVLAAAANCPTAAPFNPLPQAATPQPQATNTTRAGRYVPLSVQTGVPYDAISDPETSPPRAADSVSVSRSGQQLRQSGSAEAPFESLCTPVIKQPPTLPYDQGTKQAAVDSHRQTAVSDDRQKTGNSAIDGSRPAKAKEEEFSDMPVLVPEGALMGCNQAAPDEEFPDNSDEPAGMISLQPELDVASKVDEFHSKVDAVCKSFWSGARPPNNGSGDVGASGPAPAAILEEENDPDLAPQLEVEGIPGADDNSNDGETGDWPSELTAPVLQAAVEPTPEVPAPPATEDKTDVDPAQPEEHNKMQNVMNKFLISLPPDMLAQAFRLLQNKVNEAGMGDQGNQVIALNSALQIPVDGNVRPEATFSERAGPASTVGQVSPSSTSVSSSVASARPVRLPHRSGNEDEDPVLRDFRQTVARDSQTGRSATRRLHRVSVREQNIRRELHEMRRRRNIVDPAFIDQMNKLADRLAAADFRLLPSTSSSPPRETRSGAHCFSLDWLELLFKVPSPPKPPPTPEPPAELPLPEAPPAELPLTESSPPPGEPAALPVTESSEHFSDTKTGETASVSEPEVKVDKSDISVPLAQLDSPVRENSAIAPPFWDPKLSIDEAIRAELGPPKIGGRPDLNLELEATDESDWEPGCSDSPSPLDFAVDDRANYVKMGANSLKLTFKLSLIRSNSCDEDWTAPTEASTSSASSGLKRSSSATKLSTGRKTSLHSLRAQIVEKYKRRHRSLPTSYLPPKKRFSISPPAFPDTCDASHDKATSLQQLQIDTSGVGLSSNLSPVTASPRVTKRRRYKTNIYPWDRHKRRRQPGPKQFGRCRNCRARIGLTPDSVANSDGSCCRCAALPIAQRMALLKRRRSRAKRPKGESVVKAADGGKYKLVLRPSSFSPPDRDHRKCLEVVGPPVKQYLKAGMQSAFDAPSSSVKGSGPGVCDEVSMSSLLTPSNCLLPSLPSECFTLPYDLFYHWQHAMGVFWLRKYLGKDPSANYREIKKNHYMEDVKVTGPPVPSCVCKAPSDPQENGCGEDCLNKLMFTECCVSSCPRGKGCGNQMFQKRQWVKTVEKFDAGPRGTGVRANKNISSGLLICEYVGEVISLDTFWWRMGHWYDNSPHHYALSLDSGLVIDAYHCGSIARFINHSCKPNCEVQKWYVDGRYRMGIFSTRPIEEGEELCYDYNFSSFSAQQSCLCQADGCRGVIGGRSPAQLTLLSITNNGSKRKGKRKKLVLRTKSDYGVWRCQAAQALRALSHRERVFVQRRSPFLLRNLDRARRRCLLATGEDAPTTSNSVDAEKRKAELIVAQLTALKTARSVRTRHLAQSEDDLLTRLAILAQILKTIIDSLISKLTDLASSGKYSGIEYLLSAPSKRICPKFYQPSCAPAGSPLTVWDLKSLQQNVMSGSYANPTDFDHDVSALLAHNTAYCQANAGNATAKVAIAQVQECYASCKRKVHEQLTDLLNFKLPPDFLSPKKPTSTPSKLSTPSPEAKASKISSKSAPPKTQQKSEVAKPVTETKSQVGKLLSGTEVKFTTENDLHLVDEICARLATTCDPEVDKVRCTCGIFEDDGPMIQCDLCSYWQHMDCMELADPPPGDYFCHKCNPRQPPLDVVLVPQPEFRLPNCTYYRTLCRGQFQIRVGECLYVKKRIHESQKAALRALNRECVQQEGGRTEGGPDPLSTGTTPPGSPAKDTPHSTYHRHNDLRVFRAERLFTGPSEAGFVFGCYYAYPHETFCEPTRRFHRQEVFATPLYDTLPLDAVVARCLVLDPLTYCRGRPKFPKYAEPDVFMCELRIDKTQRFFEKIKNSNSKGRGPAAQRNRSGVNTSGYIFQRFTEPLKIKRDYSPFDAAPSSSGKVGQEGKSVSPAPDRSLAEPAPVSSQPKQPKPTVQSQSSKIGKRSFSLANSSEDEDTLPLANIKKRCLFNKQEQKQARLSSVVSGLMKKKGLNY